MFTEAESAVKVLRAQTATLATQLEEVKAAEGTKPSTVAAGPRGLAFAGLRHDVRKVDEKLEEMTGALPAKLVAMLKTHHVKEKKGGVGSLVAFVGALVLGVFGLLKIKDRIEEWEAEEEERAAIREAEEEARKLAEEEANRARQARLRAQAAANRASSSSAGRG